MEMVAQEIIPKRKLADVISDIIIKYQNELNLHKLARMINLRRLKQLKEKEKLMEKSFHGGGSFKQTSLKFFSSNIKIKTKSDNVSFNSKNSFKFFTNSQKMKTKSDSKLSLLSPRRGSQFTAAQMDKTRGSLLMDFKRFLEDEQKKKEEKQKNIELFNKKMKKIEKVPAAIVNAMMMDKLNAEITQLNDIEKKIIKTNKKDKQAFK